MKLNLIVQQSYKSPELVLKAKNLKQVILTVLEQVGIDSDCELGIACVDYQESHDLNLQYRKKDKPTNVLSFPSDIPDEVLALLDAQPLGDLVICIPVIVQEAKDQHKTLQDHFTHMLVHGTLHLLGYDHELNEQEAQAMETLEVEILAKLGIGNPYGEF